MTLDDRVGDRLQLTLPDVPTNWALLVPSTGALTP